MKILISAGPTREKIDPIRFISNRSTGKMGYALAAAAHTAGHVVTLVSGPVVLPAPAGVSVIMVETAEEMYEAMINNSAAADMIIMSAAVADYRPVTVAANKIKKQSGTLLLELERTKDILATLGINKRPDQKLIGFAAESENIETSAIDKLRRKNLDWIIANQVEDGFGQDTNHVIIFNRNGERLELPTLPKSQLATEILKVVVD